MVGDKVGEDEGEGEPEGVALNGRAGMMNECYEWLVIVVRGLYEDSSLMSISLSLKAELSSSD